MGETTGDQRYAPRRGRAVAALVAVICAVGLAGSGVAAGAVDRAEQRHAGQLIDQYADQMSQALAGDTNRYRDTLSDLAAAVGSQSHFTAADFSEITSKLSQRRLPGATGVGFVAVAGHSQVAALQAFWQSRGAPGLILKEAGSANEHLFTILHRSLDGGNAVSGGDLSVAPEPADALHTSRLTGQVAASHTYVLLRDRVLPQHQQQMSFMLAAPVYGGLATPDTGRFRGWIVMGMRGGDLIEQTLRAQSRKTVAVTLTDMSTNPPTVVARPDTDAPVQAGPFSRERTIIVGQRHWQLRLDPTGTPLAGGDQNMAVITLGIAVLITLLVAAMAGILAGARNRAMNQVDQATAALRDDIRRREATETQLRERESDLRHLALHDPLTGLANRTLFHERVEHALATHSRIAATLAVLFIDLDGFKRINDTFGHSTGDHILTQVAGRLQKCVRAGDTVARFGGDEFAVLAEQITTTDDAAIVASRIIHALQHPYDINGTTHQITASVGVALRHSADQSADHSADTIIHHADQAMYAAKEAGKNRYTMADPAHTH